MAQNLLLTAMPRHPDALGIPLQLARQKTKEPGTGMRYEKPLMFAEIPVIHALIELELEFKGFSRSLLPVFFSTGRLTSSEKEFWSTFYKSPNDSAGTRTS